MCVFSLPTDRIGPNAGARRLRSVGSMDFDATNAVFSEADHHEHREAEVGTSIGARQLLSTLLDDTCTKGCLDLSGNQFSGAVPHLVSESVSV